MTQIKLLILGFVIGLNQILREELLIALLASDHDMVVRSLTDVYKIMKCVLK